MSAALLTAGMVVAAAVGASIRYTLSRWFNGVFPYGTLAANLAASFLAGYLIQLEGSLSVIASIGALGAMSTWSTVANEAAEMARDRQGLQALLYVWATTASGVVAAWIGIQVALTQT